MTEKEMMDNIANEEINGVATDGVDTIGDSTNYFPPTKPPIIPTLVSALNFSPNTSLGIGPVGIGGTPGINPINTFNPINSINTLVNFAKDIGTGRAIKHDNQTPQAQQQALEMQNKVAQKAITTTDPAQKERLLSISGEGIASETPPQDITQMFSPDITKSNDERALDVGTSFADLVAVGTLATNIGKMGFEQTGNYLKNVATEEGGVNKLRKLFLPWENFSKTGGSIAEQGARNAADIEMGKVWNNAVDEALASRDPAQLNAIKSFASMGQDATTKNAIMKASAEELKQMALESRPTKAIDALMSRREYGDMASWSNFIKDLFSRNVEPGKSKAAKIMYSALNQELKQIPGVTQGDQIVKNAVLFKKIALGLLGLVKSGQIIGNGIKILTSGQ
jgi:hypothetical protein